MSVLIKALSVLSFPFTGCSSKKSLSKGSTADEKSREIFTHALIKPLDVASSQNLSGRDVTAWDSHSPEIVEDQDIGQSISLTDIVMTEISSNGSARKRLIAYLLSEGYLVDELEEEVDRIFMTDSLFHGMCCSLCIEMILDNKMEIAPEFQDLQKMLDLLLIASLVESDKYPKDLKLDQLNVFFSDSIISFFFEKLEKFIGKKYGLQISFINGSEEKIYNSVISLDELSEEFFKEEHNLILLTPSDNFHLGHVIYFNPKTRTIGDGADGLIVKIPRGIDSIEFLKEFVRLRRGKDKFTIFSIKKNIN